MNLVALRVQITSISGSTVHIGVLASIAEARTDAFEVYNGLVVVWIGINAIRVLASLKDVVKFESHADALSTLLKSPSYGSY